MHQGNCRAELRKVDETRLFRLIARDASLQVARRDGILHGRFRREAGLIAVGCHLCHATRVGPSIE